MTVQSNDQEASQSSMQSQATNMISELRRLETFTSWPDGNTPSAPPALARSGFIYSGQEYKVVCPMCRLSLDYPEYANCPDEEHRKRSPHCQLASQVQRANEILPSVTSNLPEAQSDTKILMDVLEAAIKRIRGKIESTLRSSQVSVLVDRENPNPELLRREKHRLETFFDWPMVANARPGPLAREGFFYTGSRDRVCCIFCYNIIHSWENGDDPKVEHRRHFPNCPFVQELDVGNIRIEDEIHPGNIRIEDEIHPGDTAQAQAQAPVASSFIEQNTEVNNVEMLMGTTTVRAVLEMGFSKQNVKQIVQQELENTGQFFLDAESLLDKLLASGIPRSFSETSSQPTGHSSNADPEPSAGNETGGETNTKNELPEQIPKKSTLSKKQRRRIRSQKKENGSAEGGDEYNKPSCSEQSSNVESNEESVAANCTSSGNLGLIEDLDEQSLMEENNRLKEARTCKVCMDKDVNTVFLPCGHLICCDVCSPRVKHCPLCRTYIRGTVKTFLS